MILATALQLVKKISDELGIMLSYPPLSHHLWRHLENSYLLMFVQVPWTSRIPRILGSRSRWQTVAGYHLYNGNWAYHLAIEMMDRTKDNRGIIHITRTGVWACREHQCENHEQHERHCCNGYRKSLLKCTWFQKLIKYHINKEHTYFPRVNGPGWNSPPPMNLARIGIEYATYCPATTREKTAPMALAPAKARRPRSSDRTTENQTHWTGECVLEFTL